MREETDFSGMKDEELAALAVTDSLALEALLDRYKNMVLIKARTYYLTGADREDLVQEGMIGLYSAILSYRGDRNSGFHAFAELCITRRLLTAIKGATRRKHQALNNYVSINEPVRDDRSERTLSELVAEESGGANPEELYIDRESADSLERSIREKLSRFERSVMELYIDGCNYQDIARKLNRTPKAVDNALQRAKLKVEKDLTEKRNINN